MRLVAAIVRMATWRHSVGFIRNIARSMLGCERVGHDPDRDKVKRRGGDFYSTCQACGTSLVRHGRGDWRPRTPPAE